MSLAIVPRWLFAVAVAVGVFLNPQTVTADSPPQVDLKMTRAGPRAVEEATQRSIVRDYSNAWKSLADAFERNLPELLESYFVAGARSDLASAVSDQRQAGIRSRYLCATHTLEVVFYAPEGDVMELHDTANCEIQTLKGSTLVHKEQAVLRYVVLMTPGADRWAIRHLQGVPQF